MKRFMIMATAVVAMMAMGSTAVLAAPANPHIVGTPSTTISGNSITFSASVAGLGNVSEATFNLVGTVDVSSRCYTKSNNKPQAANKQETINVDSTETFAVRNGRTNATFTVTPLSTLTCPPGQRVVIESVTYDLDLNYLGETLHTFSS
jgi:hypothetical protein